MSEPLQKGMIVLLAMLTAIIHLALGISGILGGDIGSSMFLLNGLGFLGLLVAMFIPGLPVFGTRPKLAYALMMAFAALTFVLFFAVNGFSYWNAAAIISKVAELLLVIFVYIRFRNL